MKQSKVEHAADKYVVIVGDEVVFRARTILEGLAYITGRGEGMLCGCLTKERPPKAEEIRVVPGRTASSRSRKSRAAA